MQAAAQRKQEEEVARYRKEEEAKVLHVHMCVCVFWGCVFV
jgi:hypothetical protein